MGQARRPSLVYQLGLVLVAGAMLVLPLIYLGLTISVGWAVYHYATNEFPAILATRGGGIAKLALAVTPLVVGVIVVIFLVKPIFARRPSQMQPLALNPEMEPRVYALVQEICRLEGTPAPQRIEMDCAVNASASFDRGMWGFWSNKLVLTLGLPLVAGLTQRELSGVIAHEFGHFRQGAGMRASYLIRRVNNWFARVIYERDSWDASIESAAASAEGWLSLIVACARFGVWVSRSVLWLLMMTGHVICSMLLRQMEYDADESEIRLAGSKAFETTTLKLATLGMVYKDLHLETNRSWRNTFRLPDNLPLLVEHRARLMSAERRERIESTVGLSKTGFLDTHPSAADRVRRARLLAEPGYDVSDEPARELFENFEAVSRLVTLAYYEDDLNVPTTEEFLVPAEQMLTPDTATH